MPNRRLSENVTFELDGLRFTATISRYPDGRIADARDAAIVLSFALQYGADVEDIRRALCRDSAGKALGPLGAALDLLASEESAR